MFFSNTGKDIDMLGKGKSIQVASKSMSVGLKIINVNKTYIMNENHSIEVPDNKNKPISNDFSYFVNINKKAVTFLKKQLIVFQEEETNVSLPNLEKVKVAYKNMFKKNPPATMGIHKMLIDIVNSLQ